MLKTIERRVAMFSVLLSLGVALAVGGAARFAWEAVRLALA